MTVGPPATQRLPQDVIEAVAERLRREPRLGFDRRSPRLALEDGTLEVDGEVPALSIKRRAIRAAASVPGIIWVVDRLRVQPSEHMGDAAIREHVVDGLLGEPALAECALRKIVKGQIEEVRVPVQQHGDVCVAVDDGVVTLDGDLPSRAHKRLAGVLSWWVPGTRDVVDGLGVLSPEQDNDEEVSDAVRMALEKDPFVDASQTRVRTVDGVVQLTGLVVNDSQREMAEEDAWYVLGVTDVINAIDVQKRASAAARRPRSRTTEARALAPRRALSR